MNNHELIYTKPTSIAGKYHIVKDIDEYYSSAYRDPIMNCLCGAISRVNIQLFLSIPHKNDVCKNCSKILDKQVSSVP